MTRVYQVCAGIRKRKPFGKVGNCVDACEREGIDVGESCDGSSAAAEVQTQEVGALVGEMWRGSAWGVRHTFLVAQKVLDHESHVMRYALGMEAQVRDAILCAVVLGGGTYWRAVSSLTLQTKRCRKRSVWNGSGSFVS